MTTLGQNIQALEVDGFFDDCQDMVKQAFLDTAIKPTLTSANSINIARWLPQMFYFFFAYKELYRQHEDIVFSVPSGNYGNICAGIMAQKLGLPIKHFVAAANSNNTVTEYLKHGTYSPKPSIATISNAMDVGNPSNFIRIEKLFDNNFERLKQQFSSYSYSDDATREAMKVLFNQHQYLSDPHGAVGYLGAVDHLQKYPEDYCVFLETAHPVKFLDTVEHTVATKVAIPPQIAAVLPKEKSAIPISNYRELKQFLNKE